MYTLLEKNAMLFGEDIGFHCDAFQLTYNEAWSNVKRLANELKKYGVKRGTKVALISEDAINFTQFFMAISKCKAACMPMYLKMGLDKFHSLLEFYQVNFIMTDHRLEDTGENIKYCERLLEGKTNYYLYENSGYSLDDTITDIELMLFSSGTTSIPKVIMLSKENMISNIEAIKKYLKITRMDRVLIVKNMNHVSSIVGEYLVALSSGSTIYFTTKLIRTKTIFDIVEHNKISILFAIPFILDNILKYKFINHYDLSSLRIVNFYGGKMQHEKIIKLCEKLPNVNFIYSYGLTEASPRVTYITKNELLTKVGSCGRAVDGVEVCIRDENGRLVSGGVIGEITVKGPNVMQGYYKNLELTKKTIRENELFTKDLGFLDDDGYLYVVGRKDNMFIIAGKNVQPEEIEEILNEDSNVVNSLVRKESEDSEKICAYVTLNHQEDHCLERLSLLCRNHLEFYKIPNVIYIVRNLEKTVSGKVIRNQVIAEEDILWHS